MLNKLFPFTYDTESFPIYRKNVRIQLILKKFAKTQNLECFRFVKKNSQLSSNCRGVTYLKQHKSPRIS